MSKLSWIGLVLVLVFVAGCGQAVSPAGTVPATGPTQAATSPDWQKKWDATVAAAKQEGTVMIYGDVGPDLRREMENGFGKKFGIQMEFVVGKGAEISVRWEREHGAGIDAADIFFTGGGTSVVGMKPRGAFAPVDKLFILPEVTDPKGWPDGKIPYLDKDKMIVPMNAAWTAYTAINTDQVKLSQITSYKDFLKPEWKDKIALYDPSITGAGGGFITLMLTNVYGLEGGTAYLKQFAATQPMITRDARLQVEWVAKGKYPIGVGVTHSIVSEFKAIGAPIAFARFVEGGNINPGGGCLEVSPKPPHPNATAILVNWLMSREGQAAFSRGFGAPPVRIDAVKDIDPNDIAAPGEKAYWTDEAFYIMQGKAVVMAKDIFAGGR